MYLHILRRLAVLQLVVSGQYYVFNFRGYSPVSVQNLKKLQMQPMFLISEVIPRPECFCPEFKETADATEVSNFRGCPEFFCPEFKETADATVLGLVTDLSAGVHWGGGPFAPAPFGIFFSVFHKKTSFLSIFAPLPLSFTPNLSFSVHPYGRK